MAVIDESVSDEEASAPPLDASPPAEMLFGAGQSTWLAVVTVCSLLSLAVSFVALFMASDATTGGSATATTAPFVGPQSELSIAASDFAFDPAGVTIFADTDTPVELDNVGAVEHNWTVLAAGVSISDEGDFDESTVVAQVSALPGEATEGSVTLEAGSYQLICTIAGHFSAGMEGVLEVESA